MSRDLGNLPLIPMKRMISMIHDMTGGLFNDKQHFS